MINLGLYMQKRLHSKDVNPLYTYFMRDKNGNTYILTLNWRKSLQVYELLKQGLYFSLQYNAIELPEERIDKNIHPYRRLAPKLIGYCEEISKGTFLWGDNGVEERIP